LTKIIMTDVTINQGISDKLFTVENMIPVQHPQ